jgi:hypothetical protein
MAEPTSTTEKAAEVPPGESSSAEAEETGRVDEPHALTIDPDAVVETSGAAAASPAKDEPRVRARSSARVSTSAATAEGPASLEAYELLARSARLGDLIALTSRIVTEAAEARVADWSFAPKVNAAAEDAKLSREDADTRFGNVLDVLGTGGEGAAERALACALWAHAVAEAPRSRAEDEDRLAGDVLWLATHTSFDATSLLDRALGDEAGDLWTAVADRIKRIERDRRGALGRGEAVFGCAALAASASEKAEALCRSLERDLSDPVLRRVVAVRTSGSLRDVRFAGELTPAPRGPIATTLLAFTGILFVIHAVRVIARVALAYRRPAEVTLSDAGVRVKTRTMMLGRTLREHEHAIVRTGLVRVVREVRYPRVAFYAGLLALAIGSYLGVRTFVDGVRAASPSLLLVGLVAVAVGVAADFFFDSLAPGSRGRCRVSFVPRTGRTLCVGDVDLARADEAIAQSLVQR